MSLIFILILAAGTLSKGFAEELDIESLKAGGRLPRSLSYDDLVTILAELSGEVVFLDVRTADEYRHGHIAGAQLFPYNELSSRFNEPDKGRPIIIYCRSGNRSSIAARTLRDMGYTNISDFGGISRWKGALETSAQEYAF